MTRQESTKKTKRLIRTANTGDEIAQALLKHFKSHIMEDVEKQREEAVEMFTAPIELKSN